MVHVSTLVCAHMYHVSVFLDVTNSLCATIKTVHAACTCFPNRSSSQQFVQKDRLKEQFKRIVQHIPAANNCIHPVQQPDSVRV